MSIAVCGIGIVSAIGIGAGETLGSLRTGRSGIGKPTLLGSAVDVPVGEVKRDNAALGSCSASRSASILPHRPAGHGGGRTGRGGCGDPSPGHA